MPEPSAWALERALRINVGCLPCTSKENEEGLLCEAHLAIGSALDAAVAERDAMIAAKDAALRETLTNLHMAHLSKPLRDQVRAALALDTEHGATP